jgi:serine protease Do
MFNMAGEVVGIVSFGLTEAGGATGLNFVVTSNMVRQLLLEEKTPWTGMEAYHLTAALARGLNLLQPEGIVVERVVAGSPAQRPGAPAGPPEGEDRG